MRARIISFVFFVTLAAGAGLLTTAHAQELKFQLDISGPLRIDQELVFGVDDLASVGWDVYDVPAPPNAPNAPWDAYLVMDDEPSGIPNRWIRDIRRWSVFLDRHVEIWETRIEADPPGADLELRLERISPATIPYRVIPLGPGLPGSVVELPWQTTLAVPQGIQTYYWIVEVDDQVAVDSEKWGGVKSRFR